MKKLIAITLLSLHLLSLYGYMAVYEYCVFQSNRLFNEQISQNKYKIDDLVAVKVPVNMPTIQDWKDYSFISGEVQFKNNCYNYVKIKMTRDTIYLMCIPNYEKTRPYNKNIIDARKIADIPVNKKERVPFGKINTLGMYNYQVVQYRFLAPIAILKKRINYTHSNIIKSFIANPGQPPDVLNTLS
jgi:hypothetical protein